MVVTVRHEPLLSAVADLRVLADTVEADAAAVAMLVPAEVGVSIQVGEPVAWMREQAVELTNLATLALLLDVDADGYATVPLGDLAPTEALERYLSDAYGPAYLDAFEDLEPADVAALVLTFASVGRDLPPGSGRWTPDQLRSFLVDHPGVADELSTTPPRDGATGPEGVLAQLYGARDEPGPYARMDEARALFESLSPDDAQILAMMFPRQVGNMDGVPFEYRADANQIHVVAELAAAREHLESMEAQHEGNQHDWDLFGRNNDDLEQPIADKEELIELYESILADDRQIILFNPVGNHDGRIAELHGDIDGDTRNVGVLVPGTGNRLNNFDGTAARSRTFVNATEDGSLAMISWIGGDLPDDVDAASPEKATTLAPLLERFSYAVDQEIEHSAAAGNDVQTTYAGHSYGGAVVGTAEAYGLRADRVLHIESAGTGYGIDSPGDLPASQDDVRRFSMTAPGDFIAYAQGNGALGLGHGADPDEFDGTTRLHTGDYPDLGDDDRSNRPIHGDGSHSGVFVYESDAWNAMYGVFTGGLVETYRTPIVELDGPGLLGDLEVVGWEDDGSTVSVTGVGKRWSQGTR